MVGIIVLAMVTRCCEIVGFVSSQVVSAIFIVIVMTVMQKIVIIRWTIMNVIVVRVVSIILPLTWSHITVHNPQSMLYRSVEQYTDLYYPV